MTLDKQVLFPSTLHETSLSSPPPETNGHHEQSYNTQTATLTERSRREASIDSENSNNSNSANCQPFWISDNTISTTSAFADQPLPKATLLVDDLFIAETLHKICPLNFSDTWFASVQAKYRASIWNDNSATSGQKGGKTQLLSLVLLLNNADFASSLAGMSQQSGVVARDRAQYLSNISEIIAAIGQFQRHRQQARGDSSQLDDKNADDSHDSAAASRNNADVELLLKDIRSYTLANLTSSSSAATPDGGESGKPAEVIDDKTTTTQSLCLTNESSSEHSNNNNIEHSNIPFRTLDGSSVSAAAAAAATAAISQRAQPHGDRKNDAPLRQRTQPVCASTSALLDSILCRLAKLLHSCIESESTRYEFYQIFSDAIHGPKMDAFSDSYKNLNGLVNSLANFDLNSSQIMLPGCSPQPTKVHTPISESANCRNEGTSLSNGKDPFTSGTMHFYQSVMDCCDELSTSGGSTSSGYGRSSTTSNSSNGMNTLNGNVSGLVHLDAGLISPKRQLFREALLSKPNHTPTSNCSTSPGNIGSGTSSALESLSAESPGSNFINSQLSAVAAELCDLDDLPKLISLSNTSSHHNMLQQSDTSLDFFTEYSQRTNLNNIFDEERSVTTKSSSIDSNASNFTISSVTPPSVSSNQCFTITMDNSQDCSFGGKFEPRSALMLDKRSTAVEVASACLNESFLSTPSTSSGSVFNHNSPPVASLVDRDLLYRLIISQLLFHGHRSIANQLASAERIKADGSLLSPSDRLHTLVSVAFRNEINQISANPTPEVTVFGNHRPTASSAPFQLSDVKEPLNNGLASRSSGDESTGFSPAKNVFERSQSHLGHSVYSALMFNHGKGGIEGANSGEANANFNEVSDVFGNVSSTDLYFGGQGGSRSSGMVVGCNGQAGMMKQLSHPSSSHLDTSPMSVNRSQSSNSLRSGPIEMGTPTGSTPVKSPPLLASTVLDLNTPSGSGAMNFVLNENAMKNLNQLAQINESACGSSSLTGNGSSSIFGRSASAMASMGPSSSATVANTLASVMAVHQMVAHGTKSPIGLSATPNGSLINGGASSGPSHTTGNGKNHKIMQIRCKFGSLGPQTNQFSSPHGFCLGVNEEIVIADTNNHRICVYEKNGTFKHAFGNAGKDEGQLWYPRKITMISSANVRGTLQNPLYVICDRGMERSRMQIFTRAGNFVRKIPIRYIDIVAGIAVNAYGQIVTVDSVSPTIFIISETGDLVEWFDCSDHMREPSDIAIFQKDYYICDFKGHCVVVFNERGKCVRKIGIESLTSFPNGIDISANGDILVGDSHGNRFHVAIFNQEGKLLTEYECPYVKVSRCCGLKLTSEGYVVTLAKNNHHVLVLNTLYITNASSNIL